MSTTKENQIDAAEIETQLARVRKNAADAKECSQLICSALNVALSILPVTGILATDWNQRIALCVSGPIVPS